MDSSASPSPLASTPSALSTDAGPSRRQWLLQGAAIAALAGGATGWGLAQAAETRTLRIGYQKSSTLTLLLKSRGVLEKALAPQQIHVQWHEFTSGLPLLEALNVGALDLSADVADAVPPFALAAGARLTYYAIETPSPTAQAIVVRKDSPITTLAQLKGKKVAFAKGAGAHYLLLEALSQAGLSIRDIEPAYLNPADGRAAFENGSVAAWVIWDPFLAAVQRQSSARVLTDGTRISNYRRFYLASTSFAQENPAVLQRVYEELQRAGEWVKKNPAAAAEWHAPVLGLDAATVAAANERRSYAVKPVDAESLTEQQRIADAFTAAQILPRKVAVQESPVWRPA
ncbi:sulfonate transport system substrate-binding protein [Roseateles sp. YR242]|uniref:aliphatic sulfonate ABC transporter substrate-binding protein n=1 Tax=Roseateles sp. YR242 TaxID=1855305 RepID=UPI0008B84503|nr:aliphatic sulfonate ABC transporter substrate-binding protein [Roseateles sp. YR242]SEL39436.1 sulfonate transport system substrate-binding protein [Roseateles sp. YR242]